MSLAPPPPLLDFLGGTVGDYTSTSPPHHSSAFKNLSPSILIIILILSVTVIASVSLCLLLRCLNRRCLLHFSAVTSSSSSFASPARRISPEQHNPTPADTPSSAIDSLPLFSFSSVSRRPSSAAADCAVCLSKFEPFDKLRLLPLCCHAFHADCVDTWLQSNQTCPLCRSSIFASESDVLKALIDSSAGVGRAGDSFRLEIGSVSRRQPVPDSGDGMRSYSLGSFDYLVEEDSEVSFSHAHRRSVSDKEDIAASVASVPPEANLAAEVAGGRNWLKEYVDRLSNSLSSRALSFRSSGRYFTGSSRRSEVTTTGDWDLEANRVGEEISELFRWFSGV